MSDEQVKRYEIDGYGYEYGSEYGTYVHADDHDRIVSALRAENEALREALQELLALADISQPMPDLIPGIVLRALAALAATEKKL